LLSFLSLSPVLSAAQLADDPRAQLLANTSGGGGVIGLGIWIDIFGFGFVFSVIRCECHRICTICCRKTDPRLAIPDEASPDAELLP
jgi:hypothetical protein